jgi:hypothetical protein
MNGVGSRAGFRDGTAGDIASVYTRVPAADSYDAFAVTALNV